MKLELSLTFLSDTTFGRGDGVSGLVDQEVEYEANTGLPFVRGRTLKGLLVEECANILYSVEKADAPGKERIKGAAERLFGRGGSDLSSAGSLHIGAARLPDPLRDAVQADIKENKYKPSDVLEMFTSIRRQTAVNSATETPEDGSLRASRVVLRDTTFTASIEAPEGDDDALALLAACVASLRRGGTGRQRGRGRLRAEISSWDMKACLNYFGQLVRGEI